MGLALGDGEPGEWAAKVTEDYDEKGSAIYFAYYRWALGSMTLGTAYIIIGILNWHRHGNRLSRSLLILFNFFLVLFLIHAPNNFIYLDSWWKALYLSEYEEKGSWRIWRNDHLQLRLPAEWSVAETSSDRHVIEWEGDRIGGWKYTILDEYRADVFSLFLIEGAREPCSRYEFGKEYRYVRVGHYDMWSSTGKGERVLAVFIDSCQVYARSTYGDREPSLVDYVLESVRPCPVVE